MSDRPRTRFDAIAEEMLEEPRMTTPEEAYVVIDEKAIACPACGLGAFEVQATLKRIVCLACPDHPVTSYPGDVTKIAANLYRCERCGLRSMVTRTLSPVNLHCRGCGALTLHARPGSTDPRPTESRPRRRTLTREARAMLDELLKKYGTSNLVAGAPDPTPGGPPLWKPGRRGSVNVDATVEAMRVTLGLEDFEEFRAMARKRNASLAVLSGEDLDLRRGSGRTTRGILKALAACLAREAEVLWMCGHRPLYDADLRRLCVDLTVRLRLAHLIEVRQMPDDLRVIEYGNRPGDHHVYVDHSFHESDNQRRLDFGMLKGIIQAQERS